MKEDLHIRTFGFCRSDIFKSTGVIVRRGSKEEEEKHVADIYALEKLSERGGWKRSDKADRRAPVGTSGGPGGPRTTWLPCRMHVL